MELVSRAIEMVHEKDPGETIMEGVNRFLPGIQINGTDILWIAYQRDGMTKSGLLLPSSVRKEDAIQGQVGLIVKRGPLIENEAERFGGAAPQLGRWAIIDTRYGMQFKLGDFHARIIEAKLIYALIERPDWIM